MSQIVSESRRGNVVRFGLDHATGWFVMEEHPELPGLLLVDEDTRFTKLSRGKLVEWLTKELKEEEVKRLKKQITYIALDLDPGEA